MRADGQRATMLVLVMLSSLVACVCALGCLVVRSGSQLLWCHPAPHHDGGLPRGRFAVPWRPLLHGSLSAQPCVFWLCCRSDRQGARWCGFFLRVSMCDVSGCWRLLAPRGSHDARRLRILRHLTDMFLVFRRPTPLRLMRMPRSLSSVWSCLRFSRLAQVGKTSDKAYKACFAAFMSMSCASAFPKCRGDCEAVWFLLVQFRCRRCISGTVPNARVRIPLPIPLALPSVRIASVRASG